MRSRLVEVGYIGIEDVLELLLLKDQQVIEAFLPHAPQEALADSIGSWGMYRRLQNLNCTGGRYPSKARPEFAVVITNQILGCVPIRSGFAQLLRHPGISRGSCHADMNHFPRLQEGEEEGKERSKEEIGDRKARRTPRPERRGCEERSPTSVLVAGGYEQPSCTSGSCAYRRGCPVSIIPRESSQHPKADCPSPFA
jgi:hypothetical protein